MKKCCVDTAYRVEEDYRKRVKQLEAQLSEYAYQLTCKHERIEKFGSAMQEFVDRVPMHGEDGEEFQTIFKELLK